MSDNFVKTGAADTLLALRGNVSTAAEIQVTVQERCDSAQIQLIARNNNAQRLKERLTEFLEIKPGFALMEGVVWKDIFVCGTGPMEYWLLINGPADSKDVIALIEAVGDSASVFDQTAGRSSFRFSGAKVESVFAKGMAHDLNASELPGQYATQTAFGHISALIARRTKPDCYDVLIPRSFTTSFVDWLSIALREYDYAIEAPSLPKS